MGENEGKAKSEKSENIYPLPLLGETVPGRGKVSAYLFASESVQVTKIGPSVSAAEIAEIPVFKKFEIRESGVKDAGDGLYLMESAADGEEIARYSGDVLTAQQARVSDSQYIVKVSTNVFLDASADGHWEGKMANCARKAKRKVNARILAASKPRFCKASKKFWLPMLAVGSIASGEEVFADYGDEFWPEGGRLQTPEANDAESEEEVYDDDMDPSWEPVSKKLEQSSTAKDANTSNNKSQSNATKANTSNKNTKQSGATKDTNPNNNKKQSSATKSGKTKNTKKTKTRTTKSKRAVTKQSSASKAANTKQSNATKTKKKTQPKPPIPAQPNVNDVQTNGLARTRRRPRTKGPSVLSSPRPREKSSPRTMTKAKE